ncbi:hypothetical protein BU26DRAFT_235919 [Trematosphaeria pertusa]|uniref:Uncharacterized protein n=1 Tax=Trematosphaeria pertusa TaxID=390896 RepID=A0A6A6IUH8_9PLEO|nr:uncharacterized protein BU26DRAFT_235919 [Trematosphaeria pertusa]KAF2254104.1 hypothetical protein BU26DRAFT_235919 [Trematosphaeria pertusa]
MPTPIPCCRPDVTFIAPVSPAHARSTGHESPLYLWHPAACPRPTRSRPGSPEPVEHCLSPSVLANHSPAPLCFRRRCSRPEARFSYKLRIRNTCLTFSPTRIAPSPKPSAWLRYKRAFTTELPLVALRYSPKPVFPKSLNAGEFSLMTRTVHAPVCRGILKLTIGLL